MEQIVILVVWAAIFQGIFLSAMFISLDDSKRKSNTLLGLFIISMLIEPIGIFLPYDSISGYSLIDYFSTPETKILFPLLFLHYVLNKLGAASKYGSFLKLNYLLGIIVVSFTIINLLMFVFTDQALIGYISPKKIELIHLIQQTYGFILAVFVLIASLIEINRYKKIIKDRYSDLGLLAIAWLWRFILMLVPAVILWGAETARMYVGHFTGRYTTWNLTTVIWGIIAILIYYVSYKAYRKKDLLDGLQPIPESQIANDNQDSGNLAKQLTHAMDVTKLYLKEDLTIYDLAKEIESTTRKVSNCINTHFQSNFSEWVNRYRVEEVKLRFQTEGANNLTIEAIGQEAGFKSRSAMYAAFKRFTGQSPAYFKR
ncbi:MAG: AraC family transcriptional regulator [Cyclobacteriaceae bacterium]